MTSVADNHVGGGESYSGFAKLMHWVIAACVLVMIPVGIIMANIGPSPLQNQLYDLHRSLGVLILALMIIRLIYRLSFGAPAPEPTIEPWQRAVSQLVYVSLYALLIAQGLIGWVATSAFGAPIWVFGLFIMPDLVSKDLALAQPLFAAHFYLGLAVAGLIILHIGAALYHYFIRRDRVLQRMLP